MMKIKLTMQLMIEVAREEGYSADSDQVDAMQKVVLRSMIKSMMTMIKWIMMWMMIMWMMKLKTNERFGETEVDRSNVLLVIPLVENGEGMKVLQEIPLVENGEGNKRNNKEDSGSTWSRERHVLSKRGVKKRPRKLRQRQLLAQRQPRKKNMSDNDNGCSMNVCSGESDNDNGCSMIVCSGEKVNGMTECNDDVEKMIVNHKDKGRRGQEGNALICHEDGEHCDEERIALQVCYKDKGRRGQEGNALWVCCEDDGPYIPEGMISVQQHAENQPAHLLLDSVIHDLLLATVDEASGSCEHSPTQAAFVK